jgi:AcrR family transcriptional regulator
MKPKLLSETRGRPRAFDIDQALDRAVEVFWRKGYEGTSLSDLTRAMGINRPSLYAAFGDKRALFRKVIDRYTNGAADFTLQALQAPKAREVAERLLFGAAEEMCGGDHPAGCLLVQGALAAGNEATSVRRELASRRDQARALLHQRLRRAKKEGDLPPDADPAALARYLMTVLNGMAVQGAGGASRKDLRRVAEVALQSWPKSR